MKKIVITLLTAMLLVGCSSGVSQSEYDKVVQERDALKAELAQLKGEEVVENSDPAKNEKQDTGTFDRKTVSEQLILTDYIIDSKYSDYIVTSIKNPTNFDIEIMINQSYKDADGNTTGVNSKKDYCLAAGGEIALWSSIDDIPATVENAVDVKESMYKGFSNLSYDTNIVDKKVIITATNNEDKPISFLEYTVVFFNGETPIGIDTGYLTDTDYELKPGASLSAEAEESKSFDNIKIYFSGYLD